LIPLSPLLLCSFWSRSYSDFFGTTLGKAIFWLRIEAPDGKRLTYREAYQRTGGLLGKGLGYNIPIYDLVCQWKSYKRCSEQETQPWDESIAYTMKDTKWYRAVLYIAANAALLGLAFVLLFSQLLPPNRGELTVSEFSQNFNYYTEYFDVDFSQKYLDEDGHWADKPEDPNTFYFNSGNPKPPEYHYIVENGALTGLSFAVEIKNNQTLINGYDTQMLMVALAFAAAQKEAGLFSNASERLSKQLETGTLEGFDFTEFGVSFSCKIQQVGYESFADPNWDFLIPNENAAETYFKLDFSMQKVN